MILSHHHTFSLCWPIWIVLTWWRLSLKKLCFKPSGSDVSYIGNWRRAIYLCDRKTDRQMDRQTDRQKNYIQIYFAVLELPDLISLSVDGLSPNCQWTVLNMYLSSISLPVNVIFWFFSGGGGGGGGREGTPDIPHSFGCKATDWLWGISSSFKKNHTWSQFCHFGWSLRCSDAQRYRGKHCSVSSIRTLF